MTAKRIDRIIGGRLRHSFTTLPGMRHWLETAVLLAAFSAIALPVGLTSGLLTFSPTNDSLLTLLAFAAVALVVPSLFEETIFRALALPHPSEHWPMRWIVVNAIAAVLLFVGGHPLIAWLFTPAARPLFFDPRFLSLSAAFGTAATIAYLRSGSIWPGVLMHWAVVVAWKCWFGGWIMAFGPPR